MAFNQFKAAIHCDLVTYDLVMVYGIESSSILYNTSYAMYDRAILWSTRCDL